MINGEHPFGKVRHKMVTARIEFMGQLAQFSKEELQLQSLDDEWSPLRIAHHLYLADGLALQQMQLIQNEDNPLLSNLAQEAVHLTRTSESPTSLEAVLAGMAARREEIFTYLASLPVQAWERPFRHDEWGDRKFYQLVNVLPMHDQQHAQQLAAFRSRLRAEAEV